MTEKKLLSSSSWGCELKCTLHSLHYTLHGHPLREDVSWNALLPLIHSALIQSSSSWGCELKYLFRNATDCWNCHPLREDVSWNIIKTVKEDKQIRHPLREDVSWNDGAVYIEPWEWGILFVRMWVEMMLDTVVLVQVAVILLVKMWVEILKSTVLIIVVAIWFFLWGGELKYPW